jgi:hypothetical protein
MNSTTNTHSSGGIGFAGLLTVVFITLKLLGIITWSWWWVLSPIWISFGLVATILAAIAIGAAVVYLWPSKK